MKLSYFKDPNNSNFGDDLNAWMWPKLLHNFFDDDEDIIFVGIGSIIGKKRPDHLEYKPHQRKVVFGAGFVSGYHDKPDLKDGSWDVFFVRGPRTAQTFELAPESAIGDSAILLRKLVDFNAPRQKKVIGYMPHWESMGRGNWSEVCRLAGIRLIDPRLSVDEVLQELLNCELLVTEAMHGAIVGDALRIPWIAITPHEAKHREKWFDWSEALGLSFQSHYLPPSTVGEIKAKVRRKKLLHLVVYIAYKSPFAGWFNRYLTSVAAKKLTKITASATHLSSDSAIEAATLKMEDKLKLLVARYGGSVAAHF
jgi:succinoglycan biosynthesis protein ExoV